MDVLRVDFVVELKRAEVLISISSRVNGICQAHSYRNAQFLLDGCKSPGRVDKHHDS
jgi:hypothetical protein